MLRGEAKREYQRAYMRRKYGFAPRGSGLVAAGAGKRERGSGGKGDLDPTLDPLIRGEFRPQKSKRLPKEQVVFPNPYRSKSAKRALDYMAYINARGYSVDRETGEMKDLLSVAQERVEALERQLLVAEQRITLLEAEMASRVAWERAEAILDDQRRELLEEEL